MDGAEAVEVGKTLIGMGVEGAIISVLMGVITILASVIVVQYKQAQKVYGYRLKERDDLNKALTDSASALRDMVRAVEDRNDITEDLAEVIQKQALAFEGVTERVRIQYEGMREDHTRSSMVITAMSESIRVMAADVNDVKRNFLSEVKATIHTAINANGGVGRKRTGV